MQAGESELHLGLNARRSRNTDPGCLFLQVIQQRGLADSRLAVQDKHAALTRPHLSEQPVERSQLGPPATQSRPRMTVRHWLPPRSGDGMKCRAVGGPTTSQTPSLNP
jgi:hypothetical protein